MKNIVAILLALLVFSSSCEEQLDVVPEGELLVDNFFGTPTDFDLAVIGLYEWLGGHSGDWTRQVGGYFRGLLVAGRVGTDEMKGNPNNTISYSDEVNNYTFTSLSTIPEGIWLNQYKLIYRCNLLLSEFNKTSVEMTVTEKQRMLGEIYFLRGFAYFQLVRYYGGVPVITEEDKIDEFENRRNTLAETYTRVVSDFELASEYLPIVNAVGRATSFAAKTMLAKAYLQMAGNPLNDVSAATKAAAVAKDVIDNGPYSLEPVYGDIFELNNEHGVEYIFDVEYIEENPEGGQVGTWSSTIGAPGYKIVVATADHAESYDPADLRFARNVADYKMNDDGTTEALGTGEWFCFKWRHAQDAEYTLWQSPFNFPITRYADVLLTYAEALWRAAGSPASYTDAVALDAINQIRRRGYGLNPALTAPSVDLSAITEEALLNERSWELAFEGHRYHDLNRFGKLVEKVRATVDNPTAAQNIQEHHTLFPIPESEIRLSDRVLEQNPGYTSN